MAVTVITRKGKGKVKLSDGKEKEVVFDYKKIVTPATKRGGSDEKSEFPTFADLAAYLQGKVEFPKNKDGETIPGPCLVQYAIDGWNLESNRNAKDGAANTPEVAKAKAKDVIAALAAKLGVDVNDLLLELASK